jgi:hypothetical protein
MGKRKKHRTRWSDYELERFERKLREVMWNGPTVEFAPPKTLPSLAVVKRAVPEATYISYTLSHTGELTLEVVPAELRERVLEALVPDGNYYREDDRFDW